MSCCMANFSRKAVNSYKQHHSITSLIDVHLVLKFVKDRVCFSKKILGKTL